MHVISLKDFKAGEIFKRIENKLKNREPITNEDIASLQLIIYTDFKESKLEILNRARKLLEKISETLELDINEKRAVIYLFNVVSSNMLDDSDYEKYVEENSMLLNPVERYMEKKGIEKGKLGDARNMLKKGYPIKDIVEITGLCEEDILNSK